MIVDARCGDIGVSQPLLNLGDISLIVERIGCSRRPERMGADFKAQLC
jgi:hypothetical protein